MAQLAQGQNELIASKSTMEDEIGKKEEAIKDMEKAIGEKNEEMMKRRASKEVREDVNQRN